MTRKRRMLLVSGSPELEWRDDAKRWGQKVIRDRMDGMCEWDILLTSDEKGPNEWALHEAQSKGVQRVSLQLTGSRYDNGAFKEPWHDLGDYSMCGDSVKHELWSAATVKILTSAMVKEWDVSVLTLAMPTSKHAATGRLRNALPFDVLIHDEVFDASEFGPPEIVWIDLETGGTSYQQNPILEIGAIRTCDNGKTVISTFETKLSVPPELFIYPEAALVCGYKHDLWLDAPDTKVAMMNFLDWLPNREWVPAGYNANFDQRFLDYHIKRLGLPLPKWMLDKTIDPLKKVLKLKKGTDMVNAKLDTACERWGIPNDVTHRALPDAERCRLLYWAIMGVKLTSPVLGRPVDR